MSKRKKRGRDHQDHRQERGSTFLSRGKERPEKISLNERRGGGQVLSRKKKRKSLGLVQKQGEASTFSMMRKGGGGTIWQGLRPLVSVYEGEEEGEMA